MKQEQVDIKILSFYFKDLFIDLGSSDEAESNESIDETEDSGDEHNSLYPNIREFKKPEPIVIRHDYKSDNSKRNTYE